VNHLSAASSAFSAPGENARKAPPSGDACAIELTPAKATAASAAAACAPAVRRVF
jgi:hypothetical protein